ncbi:MAG TPA: hypothetical protein VFK05_18430 [Polyangiaceae bacterium]|nr:hypothetical protein [Polyangiaceae bacterium]
MDRPKHLVIRSTSWLGFIDIRLVHDGITSHLPANETDFNGPPANWDLCFIDPNTSWSTSQIPCSGSTTAGPPR